MARAASFDLGQLVGRDEGGRRTDIPTCIRAYVLERDGRRCRKCSRPRDLELHHIHEVSAGGDHRARNLITLCTSCHDEWTYLEPCAFDVWLGLPPARWLISAFARKWPEEVSAAKWQRQIWDLAGRVYPEIYDLYKAGRLG